MPIISYAQAKEDILLFRALKHVHHEAGFYIDVGANDPDSDSVTKLFYDHGWRGINIEPSPDWFNLLKKARGRDINIQAAVSSVKGEATFHDNPGGQLGTLVEEFADRHEHQGHSRRTFTVEVVTLSDICLEHAPKDIHFLKIDVEGHEGKVLEGMDFTRFRPWILVIEATEPMKLDVPTYHEWDQRVRDAGYLFVFTDVLNRYYVATEHADLATHFSVPADDYVLARNVRLLQDQQRNRQEQVKKGFFKQQDDIRSTLRLLEPGSNAGIRKRRFGGLTDGGYVMLDDRVADTAISIGLSKSAAWEEDVRARGVTVHRIVGVSELPDGHIGALIAEHDAHGADPNLMLRLDVGLETWDLLDSVPRDQLARFTQIICEFHGLRKLAEEASRIRIDRVLLKLATAYSVVHVHGNNFAGISDVCGIVLPNVLQVTFANKRLYVLHGRDDLFPGELDAPCDPGRPDLWLGSFRF